MEISHFDRMKACIQADPSLDRPPVALWRHFPVDDQTSEDLAAATIAFQETYDFDFIKVTPASSFCLKDWGVEDRWEGNILGTRRYINIPVKKSQDWEELKVIEPQKSLYLSAQLKCLKQIRCHFPSKIPIIQTIFSPLAQAKNLAGEQNLLDHIREYPDRVSTGLKIIALSTQSFIERCIEVGIDGIFFAVQHAQEKDLTWGEYITYGLPYDLLALSPAKTLWCNVLHLHGNSIYFNLIEKYGNLFPIVNWHDQESPPSLFEAQKYFDGVVCGGIGQNCMYLNTSSQLAEDASKALQSTEGKRHILGTGCVMPIITPHRNILAIRQSVENR